MNDKILVGDIVLVRKSPESYSESGDSYCYGYIVGIGQYGLLQKNLYRIQVIKQGYHYKSIEFRKHSYIFVTKENIHMLLKRDYDQPQITINDTINVQNTTSMHMIVQYIGRELLEKGLTKLEIQDQNESEYSLFYSYRGPVRPDYSKISVSENISNNTIYYACSYINNSNVSNKSAHDLMNHPRYFDQQLGAAILVKQSKLRKYCATDKSNYYLLIVAYLKEYRIKLIAGLILVINRFIYKNIGFTLKEVFNNSYSYGTLSISNIITEYNAFDIDDNMYGLFIRIDFQSSSKSDFCSRNVIIENKYSFCCVGEQSRGNYTHYRCLRKDNKIDQITKIIITRLHKNNPKPIEPKTILSEIAKKYGISENIFKKKLKKKRIKLYGITYNKIKSLKGFTCEKEFDKLVFRDEKLIAHIQERDKDKVICFDGNGMVLMANGTRKNVCELNVGDKVVSYPNNISIIQCKILNIVNQQIKMTKLSNKNTNSHFWITFEHPILVESGTNKLYDIQQVKLKSMDTNEIAKYNLKWILPKELNGYEMRYEDNVYNFMLNSNHTINVNGYWCCTLGHNYKGNVIEHVLWGNSVNITKHLKRNSNTFPNVIIHRD